MCGRTGRQKFANEIKFPFSYRRPFTYHHHSSGCRASNDTPLLKWLPQSDIEAQKPKMSAVINKIKKCSASIKEHNSWENAPIHPRFAWHPMAWWGLCFLLFLIQDIPTLLGRFHSHTVACLVDLLCYCPLHLTLSLTNWLRWTIPRLLLKKSYVCISKK